MKIINVFTNKLFSIHYDNACFDEFDRLFECWKDTELLSRFLEENGSDMQDGAEVCDVIDDILSERDSIIDKIIEIAEDGSKNSDEFFWPLNNFKYQIVELSLRKGKASVNRKKFLRLYGIRIDANVYLITGGAIKLPNHHLMKDRPHTQKELEKLRFAKDYLKDNGIFDDDSFHEYLNEK